MHAFCGEFMLTWPAKFERSNTHLVQNKCMVSKNYKKFTKSCQTTIELTLEK